MNDLTNLIQLICLFAIPVIFAVTVHEACHGYVANYYGDRTAKMLGRLTLNPIKHIDLIGTIIIPLTLIVLNTGLMFGWAKPVPVDPRNLKSPRRQLAIIAFAGPCSNFVMALAWALLAKIATLIPFWFSTPLFLMATAGIQVNFILMLLNMLPLPPLDGSKILNSFLSGRAALLYDKIEPYGFIILILLLITGILNIILTPLFYNSLVLIRFIFGL